MMEKEMDGIPRATWDGLVRPARQGEGPGAATATPVTEAPEVGVVKIIEVDHGGGHTLEPEYKRVPVGPDHILYPILIGLALFPILLGSAGHHIADDMPEEDTHPFFPDHFWPYPIIMVLIVITVGLLSAFVQKNMQLEATADPRAVVLPRPDWYFLFLFQYLKLGNEFILNFVVLPIVVGTLLLWPFIDSLAGTRMANRLGWATWPVPGRNVITGTGWILFLGFIFLLTLWALSGVTLFGITGG
jgi:quinol-cytochrome oxidoreductase complex cytochrome b subunit